MKRLDFEASLLPKTPNFSTGCTPPPSHPHPPQARFVSVLPSIIVCRSAVWEDRFESAQRVKQLTSRRNALCLQRADPAHVTHNAIFRLKHPNAAQIMYFTGRQCESTI